MDKICRFYKIITIILELTISSNSTIYLKLFFKRRNEKKKLLEQNVKPLEMFLRFISFIYIYRKEEEIIKFMIRKKLQKDTQLFAVHFELFTIYLVNKRNNK